MVKWPNERQKQHPKTCATSILRREGPLPRVLHPIIRLCHPPHMCSHNSLTIMQHPETLETIDPCQTQPYRTVPRTLPRAISVNFALICLQMRGTVTHSRNTWRGRIPWSSWSSFDFLFVQCCPGERFVLDKIYRFLQRVIAHTSHIACTFTYIHTYVHKFAYACRVSSAVE